MNKKVISPIGIINTNYKEKFGIPRQSGRVESATGTIKLLCRYNSLDSVREIEQFSHLILIFDFNKAKENPSLLVRPPRLGGNKKVGVFASRSPYRPNRLGLSIVKLDKVEEDGNNNVLIKVKGVDILDNTPIYDIKPYIPSADRIDDAFGGYAEQFTDYKLSVVISNELSEKIDKDSLNTIVDSLSEDPRPSYQQDGKVYGMRYANYNVKFIVENTILNVIDVEIIKQTK